MVSEEINLEKYNEEKLFLKSSTSIILIPIVIIMSLFHYLGLLFKIAFLS